MKLVDQYILLVSNEPWSDVWFSKHNYAWELAKNNKVYFVNSPSPWKFSNLFRKNFKITIVSGKLSVIDIQNRLPSKFKFLKEINNYIASLTVKRNLPAYEKGKFILWNFTPLFLFRPRLLNLKFSLFHIVDQNWSAFYGTSVLAKQSDALIIVSEVIRAEYSAFQKKIFVIGHGISDDEFVLEEEEFKNAKSELNSYGNFGLFVGSLDHRIDYKFIERLSKECPDVNFVFVGPVNLPPDDPRRNLFNSGNNIHSIGKRHYKQVKYYIKAASFCISPMDFSVSGNNIAHHKTLPYLAQGKRIFGPVFSDYKNFSDIMTLEDDQQKLIREINSFTEKEPPEIISKRISFAKEHSYTSHLKKIEIFINEINEAKKTENYYKV